jgi:hypothetical protein
MSDEGGEQMVIAKATEECSGAEWNRISDALKVSCLKLIRNVQEIVGKVGTNGDSLRPAARG